ncbi:MAG: phosphoribosyltransferase family protein [Isosphaeraceae bacterium]
MPDRIQEPRPRLRPRDRGRLPGQALTIVGILTGCLVLLADLIREIHIPHRVALLQASSYRGTATSAGTLVLNESFAPDIEGRDVLLLDDILDTGVTLSALYDRMKSRGVHSVRTAVLLRKVGRQTVPFEPDYTGFSIPDAFVIGYGLDYNDDYRHLPHIAIYEGDGAEPGPTP